MSRAPTGGARYAIRLAQPVIWLPQPPILSAQSRTSATTAAAATDAKPGTHHYIVDVTDTNGPREVVDWLAESEQWHREQGEYEDKEKRGRERRLVMPCVFSFCSSVSLTPLSAQLLDLQCRVPLPSACPSTSSSSSRSSTFCACSHFFCSSPPLRDCKHHRLVADLPPHVNV